MNRTMDVKERLLDLLRNAKAAMKAENLSCDLARNMFVVEFLMANGVTVQEHGYLETVVEAKDNTVCGNGVKIEYKRCSCCKKPAKFFEDDFCWNCGAKLDLPQTPKGE